jgi:hypothetical protein
MSKYRMSKLQKSIFEIVKVKSDENYSGFVTRKEIAYMLHEKHWEKGQPFRVYRTGKTWYDREVEYARVKHAFMEHNIIFTDRIDSSKKQELLIRLEKSVPEDYKIEWRRIDEDMKYRKVYDKNQASLTRSLKNLKEKGILNEPYRNYFQISQDYIGLSR